MTGGKFGGLSRHPVYRIWASMLYRCENPNCKSFRYYGGRGITVCVEWRSFPRFFADMGRRPHKHTLERRDVNGGYFKENCYWADYLTQANNKRNNVTITYAGDTLTIAQWARRVRVAPSVISGRFHRGYSPKNCLFGKPRNPPLKRTKLTSFFFANRAEQIAALLARDAQAVPA